MATYKLNSYKGSFSDSSDEVVDAVDAKTAIDYLTSLRNEEPRVLQKIRTGVSVITTLTVDFITSVTAGALALGAWASPSTFSVLDGTHVVFEASAAPAGWEWVGWFRDNVLVSSEHIVDIQVMSAVAGGPVTYEARYQEVV